MTAVVHLVWGPLGPTPLRRFLASYHEHRAGVEHELVVLLNGVSQTVREPLEAALDGTEHRVLVLDQPVQDLVAYRRAAEELEHERLCFVNSHATILATDWLAKLGHALDQSAAGLVGATASWASIHSGALHTIFLPSAYGGILPRGRGAREQMHAIQLEHSDPGTIVAEPPPRSVPAMAAGMLKTLAQIPEQLVRFAPFPAYHVRTNGFVIERETFLGLRMGRVGRKVDAHVLESGRASFTRQVQRMGLCALVVDRDGNFYEADRWPRSRTFWQGDQEGLMIADNQTRSYAVGGLDRRRLLSAFAWGPAADPRLPADASCPRGS